MNRTELGHWQQALRAHNGCCALLAINARGRCKSRLATAMNPLARLELVRSMLERALEALAQAECIRHFAVVSPERDSVPPEIPVLADAGAGLNEALTHARRLLVDLGADEIVVLPADLPELTGADVDALVACGRRGGFAMAPDRSELGTNALYLATPAAVGFRFQFGPDSARCHQAEAQRLGLPVATVRRAGLSFDLDTPDDLADAGRARGASGVRP